MMIAVFAAISSPTIAQQTILDGNTLDDYCRYQRMVDNGVKLSDDGEVGKLAFCIGYIHAVLDEIWVQRNKPEEFGIKNAIPLKICIASTTSNEQTFKVAIKYLQDHPAQLQVAAATLIRLSMEEAFPCKTN